jgi:hypothetical protein
MGQQAPEQAALAVRPTKVRTLRRWHDDQQRRPLYCSGRREKGTCDADRGIAAHELEHRVLKGLREMLLDNEALVDEFAAEFKRELARLRKERHGASRRLMKNFTR